MQASRKARHGREESPNRSTVETFDQVWDLSDFALNVMENLRAFDIEKRPRTHADDAHPCCN